MVGTNTSAIANAYDFDNSHDRAQFATGSWSSTTEDVSSRLRAELFFYFIFCLMDEVELVFSPLLSTFLGGVFYVGGKNSLISGDMNTEIDTTSR